MTPIQSLSFFSNSCILVPEEEIMGTASGGAGAHTYIVQPDALAEVIDLVEAIESRGVRVAPNRPALAGRDGQRIELPEPIFEACLTELKVDMI